MRKQKAIESLLGTIMELSNFDPPVVSAVEELKEEFTERENFLREYGDWDEDEAVDSFEFKGRENVSRETTDEYKDKYEDMVKKYKERFFGGAKETEKEDIMEDQEEDIENDENATIDSLFNYESEEN